MRVLAFDTSLGGGSVAVVHGGVCLARADEDQPRALVERLLPMIEDVLSRAGTGYGDLDRIVTTVGPGTFAGLRIGVAVARGLGVATGVATMGVTSLEALAQGALGEAGEGEVIVSVIDGRRGQVYLQTFRVLGGAPRPLMAPSAVDLADLPGVMPSGPGLVVGSGAALVGGPALGGLRLLAGFSTIDAVAVAALAAGRAPGGPPRPLYLRAPDAKLPGGIVPA
ncbi:tRNA (adenosine(37)-N6)-threonylcarbamoyltransferase complex dimerization subunit type 1 TsaB [Iodidimonas sp. SYSU 1G8]|uniref:tRNA (adenosine(37)-N6)-threonylcarbamoyltransferase complex dimerization subunit type 1 TsaB n=1 Tax=Iodidimonas sp. SYSU 1G8 TaxID=3133967 RepID=UPI0031FE6995